MHTCISAYVRMSTHVCCVWMSLHACVAWRVMREEDKGVDAVYSGWRGLWCLCPKSITGKFGIPPSLLPHTKPERSAILMPVRLNQNPHCVFLICFLILAHHQCPPLSTHLIILSNNYKFNINENKLLKKDELNY